MKGGKMNKRGISDIIATVLIVLLALAAIAIVWGFIQPVIKGSGTSIDFRQKCIEAASEVNPISCNVTTSIVKISGGNGNAEKVLAIVVHSDGTTATNKSSGKPSAYGTVSISLGSVTTDKLKAAAVILNNEGTEQTCEPSATEIACTN
jgi:hypothetical protein